MGIQFHINNMSAILFWSLTINSELVLQADKYVSGYQTADSIEFIIASDNIHLITADIETFGITTPTLTSIAWK